MNLEGARPDVLVVGGGVIGLFVARALRRRGADVLVLDRGGPEESTSLGNGGWTRTSPPTS